MTTIIENEQLTEQYSWFVNAIPNEFFIKGQLKLPQISIKYDAASYLLEYPLSKSTINNLKQIATPSPFGRGVETIYDSNIRTSFELNATQFNIENFNLSSTHNKCLESIRKCLLPDIDNIICEPYKLLIYEAGSFFKSHVDTPRNSNHFGSLIISLPCYESYEGGEFILCFNDKQINWKPVNCEYIAFYSDVLHEIKPITKGYRIVITLNLMIPPNIKDEEFEKAMIDQNKWAINRSWYYVSDYFYSIPTDQVNLFNDDWDKLLFDIISKEVHLPQDIIWIIVEFSNDSKVIDSIQTILNDPDFHNDDLLQNKIGTHKIHENGVLIIFEHRYHGKCINPLTLKGRDMYLYKTFKKYFGVYLTSISVCSVVGKWSDEYLYGNNGSDDGPVTDAWEETDDRTEWKVRLNDGLPNILKKKIGYYSKFIVLYNNKQQSLVDAIFVNGGEEYYGNVGTYDLENQYQCTALLLTKYDPKECALKTSIKTKQNNWVYHLWFIAGLLCAIILYYFIKFH